MTGERNEDWEAVLRAAAAFQGVVDDTTLVGGTASALYAGRRMSFDADHIVEDLPSRFEALIDRLEQRDDWSNAKVMPPKLALGNFQGVETGLRQLRRERPLETTTMPIGDRVVTVPTPEEMLRIKAWLVVTRNKVRDYLDVVALADHLGVDRTVVALAEFDAYYQDIYQARRGRSISPLIQLARQLEAPSPGDLDTGLKVAHYKGIVPPWSDWSYIESRCREIGDGLFDDMTPEGNPGRGPNPSEGPSH